jgi:hypothetical protein
MPSHRPGNVNVRPVNEIVSEFRVMGLLDLKGHTTIVLNENPDKSLLEVIEPGHLWKTYATQVWPTAYPDQAKELAKIEEAAWHRFAANAKSLRGTRDTERLQFGPPRKFASPTL